MLQSTDCSKHSISINITKGSGHVEYFNVFLNDKLYGKVYQNSSSNVTNYEISELTDGTWYTIYVLSFSLQLQSTKSPILIIQTG